VTTHRVRARNFRALRLATLLAVALGAACAPNRGTIGALLGQQQDGRLFVREVPDGLAADRAGLRAGDEILLVDGRDVRELNPKQLHEKLSGEVGQTVKLTLVRGEEVLRVTLKRTPARKTKAFAAK